MSDLVQLGRVLLVLGLVLAGVGLLLMVGAKVPWVGRLPGDVTFQRGNVTFYFPIVTCLVGSLLLTLLFRLFRG
jgi:DUF2905 family protein